MSTTTPLATALPPPSYRPLGKALHWIVALALLGALGIGLSFGWMPRETRMGLMDPHKALGLTVLVFGAWRFVRRMAIGFPSPASGQPRWQDAAARATHVSLLAATLAMPVSGLLMSAARGRAIDIWGLTIFPALPETSWLSNVAGAIHETAPWFLVALVALHIGAALKHHVVDRDATLARMTSSRIAPRER